MAVNSHRAQPRPRRYGLWFLAILLVPTGPLASQDTSAVQQTANTIRVRFVDADLRAVIQALGRALTKPVLTTGVPGNRVTLETPTPVPLAGVAVLLRGLVESQGLQLVEDSSFYRVIPKAPEPVPAAAAGRSTSSVAAQLFVIRLKHARASDVAATVNLLFGGSGAFSGSSGLSSGTLSDELNRPRAPVPLPETPAAAPTSHGASLAGSVTIVPDELTNALLIRASAEDYAVLKDAVDQLDIRPLQVLIEVLIVEARRDRRFSFGTDVFVPPQSVGNGTVGGSSTGGGVGDLVIRLMNLGKADIDATLRLSESRGDVQILSRPVLLASNNTEARLLVGSQRPFIEVSRLLPTDNNNQDRVVSYKDVGTKLTVRPTINQDGYVALVIQQEINSATTEVAFDAPVISTRETSTQVLVRNGQTIVLGGLRDQQRDHSSGGIPILSSIPIIGGLFGSTSRSSSQTELYLFLTPRILATDADVDSVTAPRLGARFAPDTTTQ